MKVNELIKMIQKECGGENLDVRFESYEWTDDLEGQAYLERDFDGIVKKNGALVIRTSR